MLLRASCFNRYLLPVVCCYWFVLLVPVLPCAALSCCCFAIVYLYALIYFFSLSLFPFLPSSSTIHCALADAIDAAAIHKPIRPGSSAIAAASKPVPGHAAADASSTAAA